MTPLNSPHASYMDDRRRDAALDGADLYYRQQQTYSPETQLAHLRYPERDPREEMQEPPSLPHATQEHSLREELRVTQQESALPQQSQHIMHSDVEGLLEVQVEMRRLTNTETSPQQATPHSRIHCDTKTVYIEVEEDWPNPPPWTSPIHGHHGL